MAIEKMKRLKLVAVKSEREALLRELMLLGCVQISVPAETEKTAGEEQRLYRETAGLGEYRAQLEKLLNALQLLDKYVPFKSGLFTPKPLASMQSVMDDSSLESSFALAKKIIDADEHIKRVSAEESRLRGVVDTLRSWEKLDLPFEIKETKTCFFVQGAVPASVDVDAMERELYSAISESQLIKVSSDKQQCCLLLIAMKADKVRALEVVRRYGFSPPSVADMKGTAAQNIAEHEKMLVALKAEKTELASYIDEYASSREALKLCADILLTKSEKAENAERLLCTDRTICFEGWVPAEKEKQLENVLQRFSCAWETSEPTKEDIPEVPVKLRNNAMTGPFSILTGMYSFPAYNGIDPNPFLLPFFSLFFGIIFADLGYGLIMIIGGLLYKLKVKPKGAQGSFAGLLIICGMTTSVFGILSGSFFGDAISKIAGMYGHTITIPALIDPLNNPLQVLIGSLVLGFIHLITATAINGYMLIRDGQWKDAVYDVGSLWLLFAGIALGILGITWYVAVAGAAMIVLTQGRSSPSIGGKIGNGIFGLYSALSGWFGDILSYSRLFALMLAGAVIGSVFNTLGTLTGNIITFAILFLAGHALNFALSILGAFVHSLRLQYLEFFGKFYREGGKPYQPLAVKTNYFNIIEEE